MSPSLALDTMTATPQKLLLAAPRGYCAGVDRAVQTVERALELYGPPVYVRKEIVHNKHVVEQLRERGAIFVEEETEVPAGETVVFSAHGVAPSVHENAESRRLKTIDATCPLVTKVHVEAKKFAAEGYTIVLIGHAGHEEVEGTMGEAPEHFVLVETEDDVDALELRTPTALPTSLRPPSRSTRPTASSAACASASRTSRVPSPTTSATPPPTVRWPSARWPGRVRSRAGHRVEELIELNRLVVARDHGADSHLIDNETQVQEEWLEGKRVVGIAQGPAPPKSWSNGSWSTSAPAAPPRYPSSRSSRRMFASCSRRIRRAWRRGRELNPVEPQAGAGPRRSLRSRAGRARRRRLTARHRPRPPGS